MILDLDDPRVRTILAAVGVPYCYGAGAPREASIEALSSGVTSARDPRPPKDRRKGLDCSGAVQITAVLLGQLDPKAHDRNAHALANECLDRIDEANAQPGDVVLYRSGDTVSHIATVVAPGHVVTMSGGTSIVFGDRESACGQIRPWKYRADFLCAARWKA